MSSHKLVVLVVCFLLATLAITVRLAVAMPSAQESEPIKPSEPDTGEPVIVDNVTEVLTATEGLKVSMEPVAAVMTQNFEGAWPASGWELADNGSNDGGEYLWGKRNCHPHAGSYAGWSVGGGAQGSALSCTATYPNNAYTWAIYGPFDLRGASSASLTFHVWGQTEGGTNCPYDFLYVGSSTDSQQFLGSRYCGDWTAGPDGNGYTRRTFDLASRLGQSQVWIGFLLRSDFSNVFNGITVDDVTLDVVGTTPTNTPTPTPTATVTPTPTRPASQSAKVNLPLVVKRAPTPTLTPTPTLCRLTGNGNAAN